MEDKFIKSKTATIIVLITIITIGTFFLSKKKERKKHIELKTEKPLIKNIKQYINATGSLQAKDQIKVGSLVAGKVEKIIADDNDIVKKNDVLAILDDGIKESAINKIKAILLEAKANLDYQKNFFDRQKKLYESNQLSKNEFEFVTRNYNIAKAKVKQAEAELEIRQKEYENLFIKSPDDGIVISKEIDLGQMITSRLQATVLYVIAKDLQKMEANVAIDEADIGLIKVDQEAFFTVDAYPNEIFKAKVKQIQYLAKIIDNVVTYATILNVDNNELKLRPGMTTNVNIKVQEANNSLVVPNKAFRINSHDLKKVAKALDYDIESISEVEDKISTIEQTTIWILKNNKIIQIPVQTGARQDGYTQILKGIDIYTDVITQIPDFTDRKEMLIKIFKKAGQGIGKN